MWKATAGRQIDEDIAPEDDWETEPEYLNDVNEVEQRWGSKQGRTAGAIDMQKLRNETEQSDALKKKETGPLSNHGYGGKFGLETDRMDVSAMGHEYVGKVEKHASQKDYSDGFGGKFGIQTDRVDKSALGWDHIEKVEKHNSQKDHSHGFGGKFGVQTDRVDKSAVGWDHIEKVQKHDSQTDHKKGFGGVFGIEKDRMDKSAVGFQDHVGSKVGTNYTKTKPDISGAKPSNLRAKFENFALHSEEEARSKAAEQKRIREEKDRIDRDQASKDSKFINNNQDQPTGNQQKKSEIITGRSSGIENAISAFNQPSPTVVPVKHQFQLPKNEQPNKSQGFVPSNTNRPPDVIPDYFKAVEVLQEISPSETIKEPTPCVVLEPEIESNFDDIESNTQEEEKLVEQLRNQDEPTEEFVLSPDDPGVVAIALYDYQAAAADEISFDPEDIITHIEMIDEGWWRGLCKDSYGLFPANYVQLK